MATPPYPSRRRWKGRALNTKLTDAAAPRSRARRGDGDKLRDSIIDAVERLLLETGDEGAVSMRAVAKAVGITPPAIYMHFEDKDAMIQAVCDRRFRELNRVMDEALVGIDDPLAGLKAMGRAYIDFGLKNPEPYRVLMMTHRETDAYDVVPAEQPSEGDMAFMRLVSQVTKCIDAGAFAPKDPLEAALILWSAVHGLTALMITTPDSYGWPENMVDKLLNASIDGLGA